MGYASISGRARTSPSNPNAHAICDRCGRRWNFIDLQFQFDWRGAALQNLRVLVCRPCLDTPQEQWRAIVVPADPTPIINARPENYVADETDYRTTSAPTVYDPQTGIPVPGTTQLLAQDGSNLNPQPIGRPVGLEQGAIMPLQGVVAYGVPINLLSVSSIGTTIVTVTCRSAHGLATNAQISVEGLSNSKATGFYSITVTTATAFTYTTAVVISSGSLMTATTRMVTANIGLPYGYTQIPQVGP